MAAVTTRQAAIPRQLTVTIRGAGNRRLRGTARNRPAVIASQYAEVATAAAEAP